MKEYRLVWCRYPFAHNNSNVIFVEAENSDDARKIAANHIERTFGIPRNDFGMSGDWPQSTMGKPEEVNRALPAGRVK